MKLAVRISLLCVLLLLAGSLLSGCMGGGPPGEPPLTLEHARQLEAIDPDKAVAEYTAVKNANDRSNPELAAQALLESAEFTSDPNRYGTAAQAKASDPNHPSAEARQEMDSKQAQGDELARQALRQLFQHYAHSKAAEQARQLGIEPRVDTLLDQRNSKMISYKIVDFLVALTGRKPDFSYWFALLLIAVILKAVTFPLTLKMYKSQREMQKMQPIIKEIQAKYKDEPMEAYKRQQAAFKEHGVNQFASCIPSLVQLPIFFWMYSLVRVYEIHFSHGHFLWVTPALAQKFPDIVAPNLAQLDIPILLLYATTMYLTMKLTPITDPQMAQQQKSMSTIMTVMMVYYFMVSRWSSAFLLYYLFQNILSAVQQYHYIYKPNKLRIAGAGGDGAGPSGGSLAPAPAGPGPSSPAVSAATVTRTATPVRNGSTGAGSAMRPRPKRKPRK